MNCKYSMHTNRPYGDNAMYLFKSLIQFAVRANDAKNSMNYTKAVARGKFKSAIE